VARVAYVTFLAIGLTFLVGYGIGYATGFAGPLWDVASVAIYVVAVLALPFMSLVSVGWLVVDSVRKFRRCRATRTA
jgi:uncharacterized membrane protein (Fun14 family)